MSSAQDIRDYEALKRGLWWAEKQGYRVPPLEKAMFQNAGAEQLTGSLRKWAQGMIFDHDFCRAVFGRDLVDDNHFDMKMIALWAKQVMVEHLGELYAVDPNKPMWTVFKQPEMELSLAKEYGDVVLESPDTVTYDLKKIAASIPFRTHELQEPEVIGDAVMENWQYHLKKMVVSDNPFTYLKDYVDAEVYGTVRST